jgi:adenylosuccinate synthase
MPVSVVIGGQYGSEGKGKVAQHLARDRQAAAVVRVGGSNSGHTGVRPDGAPEVLRHLPTAALDSDSMCLLAAGSYIDPDVLLAEIDRTGIAPERLLIDEKAFLIAPEDREAEMASDLGDRIGSTCSGTGAAVQRRIARRSSEDLAEASRDLRPYLGDVSAYLRDCLTHDRHVVIEGTQGFGLSLHHAPYFPKATSRDTTAAAALAEAGLSPLDVADVILVLRAFPIRVAGDSGPFAAEEIDWATIATEGGHAEDLIEHTSVTQRPRRVARFEPEIVRRAILVNQPSIIVLNHVDHVDAGAQVGTLTARSRSFVGTVAEQIERPIDFVGLGPNSLLSLGSGLVIAA